jgi:hypothetical protein
MEASEAAADQALLAPALDYLEGWYAGDAGRVARAVHPELCRRFIRTIASGQCHLEDCGASKLIAWTASGEGSRVPREHRRCDVSILDRARWDSKGPDVATVKAVGARGTEYLQQVALPEGWKIINILSEPVAEAPFKFSPFHDEVPADEVRARMADDADVLEMASGYITGWCHGNRALITQSLHPCLSKKSLREDDEGNFFIDNFSYSKFLTWTGHWGTADMGAPPPKMEVKILDRTAETASVRVDWNFDDRGEPQSLDYLDGAKVDGKWLVVNVLWGFPRGILEEDWRTFYW